MTKKEFASQLREKLSRLPKQDVEDRVNFYGEMIDDLMEEGRGEQDAVDEIASRIESELAFEFCTMPDVSANGARTNGEALREDKKRRPLKGWEIALIAVTSPIWASLLFAAAIAALALAISAVAAVFSLFAVLFSLVISAWAFFIALACCALVLLVLVPVLAVVGKGLAGLALLGAAMVSAGLAILFFFGAGALSKGVFHLFRLIFRGIGKVFARGKV